MPLTPQTREELKNNFIKIVQDSYFGDTDVADYWLDKFDQLLIEKQERIKDLKWDGCPPSMRDERDSVNQVLDEAINILKE